MAEIKRVISKSRREGEIAFLYSGIAYVEKLGSEDSVMLYWNITINDSTYDFDPGDWDDAPSGSTFRNLSVAKFTIRTRMSDGNWVQVNVS